MSRCWLLTIGCMLGFEANSAELFQSKALHLEVNVLEGWHAVETQSFVNIIHDSGDANCVLNLRPIPGIELLTKDELENKLDSDFKSEEWVSPMREKVRHVKVTIFRNSTVSGRKAKESILEIDNRPKPMFDMEAIMQKQRGLNSGGTIQGNPILITKKTRLLSTLTNFGAYSFACSARYGDFDVANRAFDLILNSIRIVE